MHGMKFCRRFVFTGDDVSIFHNKDGTEICLNFEVLGILGNILKNNFIKIIFQSSSS